jgi:hypothetical protein
MGIFNVTNYERDIRPYADCDWMLVRARVCDKASLTREVSKLITAGALGFSFCNALLNNRSVAGAALIGLPGLLVYGLSWATVKGLEPQLQEILRSSGIEGRRLSYR